MRFLFSTNLLRGGFLQCQHRTATVSQYCRMTLDYFYGQVGELFSFYRIPKALFLESRFQNLSTDAKTLYGILLDRMSLSAKNGWLDEQGRVFIIFTIEDVKRALCCADNKATKLLRELEEFGLIERKRRGLGRPSLVYVKNFSADSSKTRFQNRENHESGGFKSASQDPAKPRCNKTDKNNTEMNETYADHSGQISVFIQNTFCLFFISSPIYHNDSPLFRFTSGIFRCTREQTSVSCRRC